MKRILALIMALVIMLMCAACGKTNIPENSNSPTVSSTATGTAKNTNEGPLKLSVMGRQRSGITFEDTKTTNAWTALMEMFEKSNLTLDFTVVERDQYRTVLNATISSGNVPDFFFANEMSDADRINLINQNLVMDINKALEHSKGPASKEFAEGGMYYVSRQMRTFTDGGMYYFGNVSKQISVENKVFGPNAVVGNNWCMLIRQDWLDKLGLPMPKTADEFLDTLVAFQKNDMNGNGLDDERYPLYLGSPASPEGAFGSYFDTGIAQWFGLANGVFQLNKETGKCEVPFLQEGFKDYVKFLQKCIEKNVLFLGEKNIKNNMGGNSDLDASMQANAISAFFFLANADYANTPKEADYSVMPIIQGTPGIKPVMTGSVGYKVWSNWAFSSKADPKAVAAFLDTICTQDYAKWVTFGVEGETYEIDKASGMYNFTGSNVVEDIIKTKKARGYPLVIDSYLPDASQIGWYQEYYGPLSWNSYNDFINSRYFKDTLAPGYGDKKTRNMTEWCKQADQLLMYNMNDDRNMCAPMITLDEAEVLETYENELITYMDELFVGLLSGKYSLDQMDSYIKTMNDLGLQEVLAVRQAQFDRAK